MSDIDWNAKAVVHERADGGSELDFDFNKLREGPLGQMVNFVAAMPSGERARIIMDVAGRSTMDIGQIMTLAARPDLPAD